MICKELMFLIIIAVSLYTASAVTDPRLTVVNVYSGLKGVGAGDSGGRSKGEYAYSAEDDDDGDIDYEENSYDSDYRKSAYALDSGESFDSDYESPDDELNVHVGVDVGGQDSASSEELSGGDFGMEDSEDRRQRRLHKMLFYKGAGHHRSAVGPRSSALGHRKHGGHSRKKLRSRKRTH